jgi:hypothetical protein
MLISDAHLLCGNEEVLILVEGMPGLETGFRRLPFV